MLDAIHIIDSIDTWQEGWRDNAKESLKALSYIVMYCYFEERKEL